jgi:hypothetical protein
MSAHPDLLGVWTSTIVQYPENYKTQRFENWIWILW